MANASCEAWKTSPRSASMPAAPLIAVWIAAKSAAGTLLSTTRATWRLLTEPGALSVLTIDLGTRFLRVVLLRLYFEPAPPPAALPAEYCGMLLPVPAGPAAAAPAPRP